MITKIKKLLKCWCYVKNVVNLSSPPCNVMKAFAPPPSPPRYVVYRRRLCNWQILFKFGQYVCVAIPIENSLKCLIYVCITHSGWQKMSLHSHKSKWPNSRRFFMQNRYPEILTHSPRKLVPMHWKKWQTKNELLGGYIVGRWELFSFA